jgi:lysophospholipase L1-like esterase
VIEEGLNGRTTVWNDPVRAGRKGDLYLPPCLDSHRPLDAVILFLGINDLKPKYGASAEDIAQGVGALVRIILQNEAGIGGGCPHVLVMSPPRIGKLTAFLDQFDGAQESSARLAGCIAAMANEMGCGFLDTAELVATSDLDGVHLDRTAHRELGIAVAHRVRALFGDDALARDSER